MPTYNYKCPSCHHEQQEWHSIHSKPTFLCSQCNAEMDKVIRPSKNSVLFKGKGWPGRRGWECHQD